MPVLAADRVRYVGEAVALVVAETLHQAQDAAEAVDVAFDQLPAASDVARAMAPDAPALWPEAPATSRSTGRTAMPRRSMRPSPAPRMSSACGCSTRGLRRAPWSRARRLRPSTRRRERYTLIAPTQGVAVVRKVLAEGVFNVPPDQIRILTHDVGGGFGMKVQAYAEYAALLIAARRVGRPVKWCASRLESFLTDTHGRDGLLEGELALDADGRFLALRVRTWVGIGAYTSTFAAIFATANTKNCLSSVYVIPAIHIGVKMVLTNAAPLGPYRGAGRPEAIYLIERLIDAAARRDAASTAPSCGGAT